MTNLSDSATKKIEEASENFKLSDVPYPPLKNIFKEGCKYGYTLGREEREYDLSCLLDAATNGKWSKPSDKDSMLSVIHEEQENLQSQVQLLEDALKYYAQMEHWGTDISGMRTAIDPSDQCFGLDYADIRGGKRAKKALESLSQLRGGGDE